MSKLIQKTKIHESVMVDEVLEYLNLKVPLKDQVKIIDATAGMGGHSLAMCKKGAKVLSIDTDKEFVGETKNILKNCGDAKVVWGNFKDIKEISSKEGFNNVSGILFDLGVNTIQLTSKVRGFSFNEGKARLDMRFDKLTQKIKASDLLNSLRKDQLFELFEPYIDYKGAKNLSEKIVERRNLVPFGKVEDFLSLFSQKSKNKNHPATLGLMALRIAANCELDNLKDALEGAYDLLGKNGRLVVITFHSGEDKIVKSFFKQKEKLRKGKLLTKKPILPKNEEIKKNKSARSAKLRAFEKN